MDIILRGADEYLALPNKKTKLLSLALFLAD